MKLIIVSGLSGSGKSVALHTLEDLDYYCIDNLPPGMLPALADQMTDPVKRSFTSAAIGIDARNRGAGLENLPETLAQLRDGGVNTEILFLEAENETLLKRYSETRRKHPLSGKGISLADAIRRERDLLQPIAEHADMFVDTTHTTVHELRTLIKERVGSRIAGTVSLLFESFGYRHGLPGDADYVFDVRCLPNPHWEPGLRQLSGLDQPVQEYLSAQPRVIQMLDELRQFLETWIPSFEAENRSYITVALGCTGGQHRSVHLVEELANHFRQSYDNVIVRHRELS